MGRAVGFSEVVVETWKAVVTVGVLRFALDDMVLLGTTYQELCEPEGRSVVETP